jgi:hypothetical protein
MIAAGVVLVVSLSIAATLVIVAVLMVGGGRR